MRSRVVLYAHYQSEEGRYLDALTLPAHIAELSGSRMSLCCDILRLS